MLLNTSKILSITEANQNFSKAIKIADKFGEAILFRRNKPAYKLIRIDHHNPDEAIPSEETEQA